MCVLYSYVFLIDLHYLTFSCSSNIRRLGKGLKKAEKVGFKIHAQEFKATGKPMKNIVQGFRKKNTPKMKFGEITTENIFVTENKR